MEENNIVHRKSNFELLRIFAMFSIVMFHFSLLGIASNVRLLGILPCDKINEFWVLFFALFGKAGVNIFIILNGYFMFGKNNNFKKLLFLYLKAISYGFLFLALFTFFGNFSFETDKIIKSFFLLKYCDYWFVRDYIIVNLLSPFLNKIANSINKNFFILILCLMLVFCSFSSWIVTIRNDHILIIWFIFLYLFGGYLKMQNIKIERKYYLYFIAILILILVYIIVSTILTYEEDMYCAVFSEYHIFQFLIAVFLFLFVKETNIPYNKFINNLAKATLGVYFIHENVILRDYVWNKLNIHELFYMKLFPFYEIMLCGLIFGLCAIIDISLTKIFNYIKSFIKNSNIE